jgi:hypothetical protein
MVMSVSFGIIVVSAGGWAVVSGVNVAGGVSLGITVVSPGGCVVAVISGKSVSVGRGVTTSGGCVVVSGVGIDVAGGVSLGMTVVSAGGWVVAVVSGTRVSVGTGVTTSGGCVVGRRVTSGAGVVTEAFASVLFVAVLFSAETAAALRKRRITRTPTAREVRILDSRVLPLVCPPSSG